METQVPGHHPLRTLFGTLTERSFTETLGWPDFNVTDYLSNLLVEFSHIDHLQHIKNQQGESVETVVELLYETETLHECSPQEREREIHRHIGENACCPVRSSGAVPSTPGSSTRGRRVRHSRSDPWDRWPRAVARE